MDETPFLNNPFSKAHLGLSAAIVKVAMKRDGFKLGQNNYHLLTDTEKYIQSVGKIQSELIDVFEQINIVKVFIRRYPSRKYYEENGLNILEYIKYHTEVFSHKVSTILDIMKLLVNRVYLLKLPPRDCDWKNLIRLLGANNKSLSIIDDYYQTFKTTIEARHINTHRGIYNDSVRDEIDIDYGFGIYESSRRLNYEVDDKIKEVFPKVLIECKIKNYRKDRIAMISEAEKVINFLLKEFLTSLKSDFHRNLHSFD